MVNATYWVRLQMYPMIVISLTANKRNYCIEILKTELTISHRTEAQCRRTTGRSAQANPSAPGAHHDKTWTRPGFSPIDIMKNKEMERQPMKNG